VTRPLVTPPLTGTRFVRVHDTEEKGPDVNLALHLRWDGWRQLYDVAVVLTKDTDLVEPIRILVHELGRPEAYCAPAIRFREPT